MSEARSFEAIEADLDAIKSGNKKDVELLYWTAASWGSAMSLGKDQQSEVRTYSVILTCH